MTGPEHYRQAEVWAYKAKHSDARGGAETDISCAAIAQVHATLALAAATALPSMNIRAWVESASDEKWPAAEAGEKP